MCPFFLQSGGSDDNVESEGDAAVSAEVYLPVDEQSWSSRWFSTVELFKCSPVKNSDSS